MKPINPCDICLVKAACLIPSKTYSISTPECLPYEIYKEEKKIYDREVNHPLLIENDKDWLSLGRFFQEDLRLNDDIFVDFIFQTEFKSKNFHYLSLYKEALSCILANLVICGQKNVPLSKPNPKFNKFKFKWFKKSIINNILVILFENGYCIHWKGYYVNERNCRSARYSFNFNLLKTNLEIKTVIPNNFIQMNKIDPTDKRRISRSKKRKIYINPRPCSKLTKMINDIKFINNILCNATITFSYDNEIFKRPKYEEQLKILLECNYLFKNDNEYEINKNSLYLFRVFNRADYKFGGRFYTKIFQGIPSNVRPNIKINNEATIELDYSAHHLRILYHKEGIDYQGEVYVYNKSDKINADKRMIHKKIAMIAINAETRNSAIGAIQKSLKEEKEAGKFNSNIPTRKEIDELYDDFINHHKPIAKYVGADVGIYLQRIDSDIMNEILVQLTNLNIIALPIHDSIVVQKKHSKKLKELMIYYYNKLLKFNPII